MIVVVLARRPLFRSSSRLLWNEEPHGLREFRECFVGPLPDTSKFSLEDLKTRKGYFVHFQDRHECENRIRGTVDNRLHLREPVVIVLGGPRKAKQHE